MAAGRLTQSFFAKVEDSCFSEMMRKQIIIRTLLYIGIFAALYLIFEIAVENNGEHNILFLITRYFAAAITAWIAALAAGTTLHLVVNGKRSEGGDNRNSEKSILILIVAAASGAGAFFAVLRLFGL